MNRTISVLLTGNSTSLRTQLALAAREVAEFEQQTTRSTNAVTQQSKLMGAALIAAGVAIAAGLVVSVKAAADFEREMRNVATISKDTRENFSGTGQALIDMSRSFPQSATTLAKGLYEIASSGFDGAEAMSVLRSSALAASAGLTTTEVSARGITAVLNAYGMSGFNAARVSDILFQTVNKGVITFEELASNLGDFVGMAAAFGRDAEGNFIVPIEDATAALATMTLAGISAAEASTSLNRVLQAFIKPSEAMTEHLKAQGYETGIAAVEALGLQGAIELLRVSTGGQVEALVQLFPEIRAARGALALMADEGRNYSDVAKSITDDTERMNATQRAYTEQSKGFTFQAELARNSLAAFGIEIGTVLLPVLTQVTQFLSGFFSGFAELPGPVKAAAAALAAVSAAAALGAGAFLLLGPRVVQLAAAFPNFTAGVLRAAPALTGLGILLAAGAVALGVYGERQRRAKETTEAFTQAALSEADGVKGSIDATIAAEAAKRGLVTAVERAGASLHDLNAALRGDEEALNRLKETVEEEPLGWLTSKSLDEVASGLKKGAAAADEKRRAMDAANPAAAQLRQQLAVLGEVSDADAEKFDELARSVGISAFELAFLSDKSVEAAEKITRSLERVSSSFASQTDLIGGYASVVSQRESAVKRVTSAEERLAEASERASERQVAGAERVADAKAAYADVQERIAEQIANSVERATERQIDAQERLLDAERRANDEREDAAERVANAEQRLRDLQERQAAAGDPIRAAEVARAQELRRAEEDVTRAREEQAEAEEKAARSVEKARQEEAKAAEEATRAGEMTRDQRRQLEEAERNVGKAQEEAAKNNAEALKQVARAADDLAAAQREVGDLSLASFFEDQSRLAQQFFTDLQEAARRGLDHENIKRLLEAGPRAAAPILRDILADQSKTLIGMYNDTQRGLSQYQTLAVEFGRLTQRAIKEPTDEMVRDLSTAMLIAEENMREGGRKSAAAIAKELGLGVNEVQRIATNYGITLADGINPILRAVGAMEISPQGSGPSALLEMGAIGGRFAEGGSLPDQAKFQRAGTLVQWAEPETGGEWFLPDAPAKRNRSLGIATEMLDRWGYEIKRKEFAEGGFRSAADVPRPPDYASYGDMVGYSARETGRHLYEQVVEWVRKHMVGNGYGYQALIDYLEKSNVDFQVTSTLRPGAITSSGHPSLHSVGLAADFVGDMWGIFRAFSSVATAMQELFFDPAGRSVKYGKWANWTVGGHDDHVHAATFGGPAEGPGLPTGSVGGDAAVSGTLRDWILAGIRLAGVSEGWLDPGVRRAMYESGGDPNAINLWDSNAARGTPSKGLMQVIDPTFAAYHVPGHGDIWNPVHNSAAAFRYITDRYGTIWAIDPPVSGYGEGGFHQATFDQGGWLMPGRTIADNWTGKPEWVEPMPSHTYAGLTGGAPIDYDRLGEVVARKLTDAMDSRPVVVESTLKLDNTTLAKQSSRGFERRRRDHS